MIVTDILLESTTKEIAQYPPDPEDSFLAQVYSAGMAFGQASVQPMLMLDTDTPDAKPKPVKNCPRTLFGCRRTEADVDAALVALAVIPFTSAARSIWKACACISI